MKPNKAFESSIDFPRPSLSPAVWDRDGDTYLLKDSVTVTIIDHLDTYKNGFFRHFIKDIRIVGSICSTQYADDADIDVHIVPDLDRLQQYIGNKEPEEEQKDIMKFFRDEKPKFIDTHPIEVFLQLNAKQDMMSCGVYDFRNKKWLKGPDIKEIGFNPYDTYKAPMEDVKNVAKEADLDIAELKRDLIDYETIDKALEQFPEDKKEKLLKTLKTKLKELEDGLNSLYKHRASWIKLRRESSGPVTDHDLDDAKNAANFEEKNVVAKMLNRYSYHKIIKALEDQVGTEVDDNEVELIRSILEA